MADREKLAQCVTKMRSENARFIGATQITATSDDTSATLSVYSPQSGNRIDFEGQATGAASALVNHQATYSITANGHVTDGITDTATAMQAPRATEAAKGLVTSFRNCMTR